MAETVLQFERIEKSFFGVPVLRGIDLTLGRGRVLGLVGENGAGKSTLMNLLGGVHPPDAGRMTLGGVPHAPADPRAATAAGVAFVHQELNLFTNLTIAQNLHLQSTPRRRWTPFVDRRRLREQAARLLDAVDLRRDPDTPVEALSPGERQLVEVARAVGADARVLILDEPTTSLTTPEAERLFSIVARLRERGVAIVYISHNLQDVLRLCDDIAVLRDGRLVSAGPRSDYTVDRLIAEMVGREMAAPSQRTIATASLAPTLEVVGLSRKGVLRDVSFTLHRGEILGVAGLMGSGRTELARAVFGLDPIDSGRVSIDGRAFRPSPRRSIRRGVAFLTENRREEGLMMDASIVDNAALAHLPAMARTPARLMDDRGIRRGAMAMTESLRLSTTALSRRVRTLSGGNQQKVVLAKWLLNKPSIVLLDEPSRGIDVAAKGEVHRVIRSLAERSTAVLMISSELEELFAVCDRILVMCRGRLAASLNRSDFDQERVMRHAVGEGGAVR